MKGEGLRMRVRVRVSELTGGLRRYEHHALGAVEARGGERGSLAHLGRGRGRVGGRCGVLAHLLSGGGRCEGGWRRLVGSIHLNGKV